MQNGHFVRKLKLERIEEKEAYCSYPLNKVNSGETFTPKDTRNITFFKSNPKINRHSSEEEFKLQPKNILNNQQSNHNINHLHPSIKASTSTQYSCADDEHQKTPPQKNNKKLINHIPESYHHVTDEKVNMSRSNIAKLNTTNNTLAFLHKSKQLKMKKNHPRQHLSIHNFKRIKELGQGKFGNVYLVKQISSGFILAMKIVEKKILVGGLITQFIRELKIQAFLDHPNIIKHYGLFYDSKCFYVLMELGSDGQLYNIIENNKLLTEQATSFIIKNLLEATSYMHNLKILHRDIKPQNIVLVHGNVKVCDFGWAVENKSQLRSTLCGTPLYLSPQILEGGKYDEKVDLWAIGILACELRMGCLPFDINCKDDLRKIVTDNIRYPKNIKDISKEYKQFVESILKKNPKQRMSSQELLNLYFIRKYSDFETCEELCVGEKIK